MRSATPSYRRTLTSVALLLASAGCADVATQPKPVGSIGPRSVVADVVAGSGAVGSSVGDTSALGASTATDTIVVDTTAVATPQLLVCPTTDEQRASAVIGPDGGSVSARGATLTVPAGAVPAPTVFEVVVPASRYMEADIRAVGVERYVFQSPVTITINYARCPAGSIPTGAQLQGVYVDTDTYQVLQQMGGVTYKLGRKVSFPTPHLSGYIIAY